MFRQQETPMILAIQAGDIDKVRYIVENNTDNNKFKSSPIDRWSPIAIAVRTYQCYLRSVNVIDIQKRWALIEIITYLNSLDEVGSSLFKGPPFRKIVDPDAYRNDYEDTYDTAYALLTRPSVNKESNYAAWKELDDLKLRVEKVSDEKTIHAPVIAEEAKETMTIKDLQLAIQESEVKKSNDPLIKLLQAKKIPNHFTDIYNKKKYTSVMLAIKEGSVKCMELIAEYETQHANYPYRSTDDYTPASLAARLVVH